MHVNLHRKNTLSPVKLHEAYFFYKDGELFREACLRFIASAVYSNAKQHIESIVNNNKI